MKNVKLAHEYVKEIIEDEGKASLTLHSSRYESRKQESNGERVFILNELWRMSEHSGKTAGLYVKTPCSRDERLTRGHHQDHSTPSLASAR